MFSKKEGIIMKRWPFILAVILVLSFCFTGCQPQPNPKLDDLNMLCRTLEEKHYNLYANVSKEDFLKEKEKIAKKTAKMSDAEFYWSICHLLSLIKDAHTMAGFSSTEQWMSYMEMLPFDIDKFEEGWFLLGIHKDKAQYLGTQLVAINGMSMDEIIERSKQIISFESESWLYQQVPNVLIWKDALEYLGVVKKNESVVLTVKTNEGREESFEIEPLQSMDDRKQMVQLERKTKPVTDYQKKNYWSTVLDDNIYFIQYNSCAQDPQLPMEEFAQQVDEDLKDGKYQNIILDLRYNTGGDSRVFAPLKQIFFDQYLQTNGEINLCTLIGGKTFSSGMMAAVDARGVGAVFYGQPTGGVLKSAGDVKLIEMESMPFKVQYSTKYFDLIPGLEGPLMPNEIVPRSFQEYQEGKDAEIEYLYNNGLLN